MKGKPAIIISLLFGLLAWVFVWLYLTTRERELLEIADQRPGGGGGHRHPPGNGYRRKYDRRDPGAAEVPPARCVLLDPRRRRPGARGAHSGRRPDYRNVDDGRGPLTLHEDPARAARGVPCGDRTSPAYRASSGRATMSTCSPR